MQREAIAQARKEQDVFLQLREISRLQVFDMGYARKRKVPEVRLAYAAEKRQRLCVLLQQRKLWLSGEARGYRKTGSK